MPIKILAAFTACVEFVSGWQHARNYVSTHWADADWTWMDRRTKISRILSLKIWQPYMVGVATTNLSHVIEVGESRPGDTGNKRSVRADLLGGWSDCERQKKLPGAVFRGQGHLCPRKCFDK